MFRPDSRSRSYSPPRSRTRPRPRSRTRSPPGSTMQSPREPTTPRSTRNAGGGRSRRNRPYPPDDRDHTPAGRRKDKVTMLLAVYHSSSHKWKTAPVTFTPHRINDRELWEDIRYIFRTDVQKPWRRVFGFKKVKNIVPIAFTPNGVPIQTDPKNFPQSRSLVHAYHHPSEIRTDHAWVEYFVQFDLGDKRQNGLEFVEGIWAEKLAVIAVVASVAIIIVSIVWCVLGGNLQTVFTVMGFVLTFVAAELALIALYYQIISTDTPGGGGGGGSDDSN